MYEYTNVRVVFGLRCMTNSRFLSLISRCIRMLSVPPVLGWIFPSDRTPVNKFIFTFTLVYVERNKETFQKRLSGQTLKQTGIEYGLSKERIRQIVLKQAGGTSEIIKKRKELRAKRKEHKYKSILKITEEHVRGMGSIPVNKELYKFLSKIGGSSHLNNIRRDIVTKTKLPSQVVVKKHEKMIEDLRRIYVIVKRSISEKDLIEYGAARYATYRANFGTFKKACLLAGTPVPKRGGWRGA